MSISKLLMTAAVCTVSMSASLSYGSSDRLPEDESGVLASKTASMRAFMAHDGTNATLALRRAEVAPEDDDARSQRSTTSTVTKLNLDGFLRTLWEVCKKSHVALPRLAPEASKLQRVEAYASTVVDSHNGLKILVQEADLDFKAIFDKLQLTRSEVTDIADGKIVRKDRIIAKIAEKETALQKAETRVVKIETRATIWKTSAIVSSGVLAIVAGVLINIFRKHGFEIVFGK